MVSKISLFSFYLISIFLFINFSSPFIFWMLTEINLVLFITLMIYLGSPKMSQEMGDIFLFYFVIQSLSSSLFLLDFFFLPEISFLHSDFFFMISMLVKLGAFPFFYWVFKVSDFLNPFLFSVLMSWQKIPFFLILFSDLSNLVYLFLFGSFSSGALMILFSPSVKSMLVCSSVSYSFWTLYVYLSSSILFICFYLLYSFFLFLLLENCSNEKTSVFLFQISSFMFYLGLAPLGLFFFKFLVICAISDYFGYLEILFFWFFSFLSLFGYIKFFSKFMFNLEILYASIYFWKVKMSFLMLSSLLFFFFLAY